jgi:hypothetical protein
MKPAIRSPAFFVWLARLPADATRNRCSSPHLCAATVLFLRTQQNSLDHESAKARNQLGLFVSRFRAFALSQFMI